MLLCKSVTGEKNTGRTDGERGTGRGGDGAVLDEGRIEGVNLFCICLLYTSDAADE